jgi:hypothetical protein
MHTIYCLPVQSAKKERTNELNSKNDKTHKGEPKISRLYPNNRGING